MLEAPPFKNRNDAGRKLAEHLSAYAKRKDAIILALPRGGVPVARELAERLGLPFDLMLVRKLGVPGNEELAMGAIAMNGVLTLNRDILDMQDLPPDELDTIIARERAELERRNALYRGGRPAPDVRGKTAILVDDGVATGATLRAAVRALQKMGVKNIVVAVPVASMSALETLDPEVEEIICLHSPSFFLAVGQAYQDFEQLEDEEVLSLLSTATRGT